jgi:hypothetical protein
MITFCIEGEIKTSHSTTHTSRRVVTSYHGKIVQLLVGLLEGFYVIGRQHWIIHQICGDDVLVPGPGHQQLSRIRGPRGFGVVRRLPVPSAGAALEASTCSSPPAPASACCGSGGGRSGSVASASGAGSWGVGSSRAAGSGDGVAVAGLSLCFTALADLMKPSQLYNYMLKRAECSLCSKMQTYSAYFFMTACFTLIVHRILVAIPVAGGGVIPAGGVVPATAAVTAPIAEAEGADPTSSHSDSGGEAEGLQMDTVSGQQYRYLAIQQGSKLVPGRLDYLRFPLAHNPTTSMGPKVEFWSTPWLVRGSCPSSPPPRFPSLPGGSRPPWTRCCAEPWLLKPSLLRQQRWGEGGPVAGCRAVEGSSGTVLCAPAEGFQLAVAEQNLFST